MADNPTVSVVIPTCNRSKSLLRLLTALSQQDYASALIEVIVVADGCTDETAAVIGSLDCAYRLILLEQSNMGPSGARNAGAEAAQGEILLFLDDDVEPSPGLVKAHVDQQQGACDRELVVIGAYPPATTFQEGFYRAALIHWWEEIFATMEEPAHRFRMQDVLGGNMSMPAVLFKRIGGFDTSLRCHEDYELGWRLIQAGAAFAFSRQAWALHYETSDLARSISRKFEEGRADFLLASKYPELARDFHLCRKDRRRAHARSLAFSRWRFRIFDLALGLGHRLAEALRLRGAWRRLAGARFELAYWQGAATAAGGKQALWDMCNAPVPDKGQSAPLLYIDLADGIGAVEAKLDAERPSGIFVRMAGEPVGAIPFDDHSERLHGGHLRPWLANQQADALMNAMAAAGVRHMTDDDDRYLFHVSSEDAA